MTHVLVRANKVIKTIAPLRALTTSESANGGQRREVSGDIPIYIGGTVTVSNGKVTAITNPNAISAVEQARTEIKDWLRRAEALPVANWGLAEARSNGTVTATNAQGFWWWLEMIGRASKTDLNLSDSTRRGWIEAEMDFSFIDWYTLKASNFTWRNANNFYSTPASGISFPQRSTIVMTANWDGGLAKYLHG